MKTFLLKRLFLTIPVVFGVVTLTFLLIHFVPGDPVDLMLGEQASAQDKGVLRNQLGLNEPLSAQYWNYLKNLTQLDLGYSLLNKKPVSQEIFQRVPATLELAFVSILIAICFGVPLGVWAAWKPNRFIDPMISFISLFAMSVPIFWLAPFLILIFSVHLNLLPVSERGGPEHLILPSISLGFASSALLIRMTKASVAEILHEDYIRTAFAKGLSKNRVYFKHALRNALMPVITILGIQFGSLLSGAIITETIFDWPGLGTLFYNSIQQRNYPMVQGCVFFISLIYVVVNLATDVLYAIVNPRVQL